MHPILIELAGIRVELRIKAYIYALTLMVLFVSCIGRKQDERIITPWGEIAEDSIPTTDDFTMTDMVTNGELIMLTMTGPETYYDYHGHGMGTQYLLCERFAQKLGVSVRVEVCKDTLEMVNRLKQGDADIIAFLLPKRITMGDSLEACGVKIDSLGLSWAVQKNNAELADTLNRWYKPTMLAEIKKEEAFLLSAKSMKRHVFAPMLNRAKGEISRYDKFFMTYAPMARLDWRLMAAQCYQESTFDPNARSWAGACGLMQIMPATADHLGLPREKIYDPEANIAAAARYMSELMGYFNDIPAPNERIYFALACYNGGYHHIRDAMALAQKNGRNPKRWNDVAEYVLKLREPVFYTDPIVKHGYMRGNETVDYVDKIRTRWADYRGVARPGVIRKGDGFGGRTPQKAKRKYRFHV